MAKKRVAAVVKIQIEAGQASPAPPVGTALGPHGVNIMDFCKAYNEQTQDQRGNIVPAEITIFEDRSFTFITKTPPTSYLIKKAARLEKAAETPGREGPVGRISRAQAREIAQKQFHDAWRGYDQEEVDDFLDRIVETMGQLERDNSALIQRVRELEQTLSTSREAEEMLKKTLVTAQQAAEEAIGKAKAKADQLIGEAEERARRANDEARQKVTALESDIRRRSVDADRDFTERKKVIEAEIERLRAFESELKQRLKNYLEQQLKALSALQDRTAPAVRIPEARPPAAAPQQPVRSEAEAPQAQPAQKDPSASGTGPPSEETESPARRGMRGLFSRSEG